jgi:hypothetical protein
MMKLTRNTIAAACLAASTFAGAAGQTSASFALPRDTINSGVGDMASASYRLSSSLGDAVATGTITSVSFQLGSGFRSRVNVSTAVLNLLSVVSRKIHGSTPFELTIAHTQPITGLITVEPRAIGNGHTLVFHFDKNVTSVGAATALDALANIAGTATVQPPVGNDVIVTLTDVPDNKRLTVTLTGINGSGTQKASMGFLVGDVNNSRAVNASDISGVKARSGQATSQLNFLFDINASGSVSSSDISAVKARSGMVMP